MNEIKKKVALMTIYQVPNYGSVLQTYATVKILESLGYSCDVINYKYPNEWHYRHGAKKYKKAWWQPFYVWVSQNFGLKKKHVFWRNLEYFKKKYLTQTVQMNSLEELSCHDWVQYTTVIAGSDQIWNPKYLHGDSAFMLSFVPDDVRKISFSSSFAVASIPVILQKKYRKNLNRFSYITVREENGKKIVDEELKLNVPSTIIPDPTLLISATQWSSLLKLKVNTQTKPYILLYILDYAFNPIPYIFDIVKYFQDKYQYDVKVVCENEWLFSKYLTNYHFCGDASPKNFLELISGAALIVTSSFHGTAFSVNFGRPLIAVIPEGGDDRQNTLLCSLHLENSALQVGSNFKYPIKHYSTSSAQQNLTRIRIHALNRIASIIN